MILDPGMNLTLRPMKYPHLYQMYLDAIKNTWTVDEVDLSQDVNDLQRMSPAEQHLIKRLVAFFATGDTIVANNLVLNLYQHINCPEGRMYLSRQLYEEALHVQFYLTLLDTYLPNDKERAEAFSAIEKIPSIKQKGEFCFKWIDSIKNLHQTNTKEERRSFLLNLICFAGCIEGLFFFAAFAYVYFLRSKGYLHGLATGTNWVFRDESCHMNFAFSVIQQIRKEEPDLFNQDLERKIIAMIDDAISCEMVFAKDVSQFGLIGLTERDMRKYLEYVGDQRFMSLGMQPVYQSKNPFSFMELQDVQELTNFFERRVAAYQVGIEGEVSFNEDF
ncbi:MAG: ribonucleotide-diphosphate reductase subunit beta [Bdellovibrionota bacterium]